MAEPISAQRHGSFIDVKEEGTEAAAATADAMVGAAAPVEPVFLGDHPFLFLIQENKTGSILFMGRVTGP
jgi:serpin B